LFSIDADTFQHGLFPFLSKLDVLNLRLVCKTIWAKVALPLARVTTANVSGASNILRKTKEAVFNVPFDQIRDFEQIVEESPHLTTLRWSWFSGADASFRRLLYALKQNKSIKSLIFEWSFSSMSIADEMASLFRDGGVGCVTHLTIRACSLRSAGAVAILDALSESRVIRELCLPSNEIMDPAAKEIGAFLRKNKALKLLDLSHNKLADVSAFHIGEALRAGQNNTLVTLKLAGQRVGGVGFSNFADALASNNSLTELDFTYSFLTLSNVASMSKALQLNQSLLSLYLSVNKFSPSDSSLDDYPCWNMLTSRMHTLWLASFDSSQMERLGSALSRASSLTSLSINHCNLSDGHLQALVAPLSQSTSLRTLDLSYNDIGQEHQLANITQIVSRNSSIFYLNLIQNSIYGDDIENFTAALAANTSIRSLDLSHNILGRIGVSWIAYALEDNVTLEHLVLGSLRQYDELVVQDAVVEMTEAIVAAVEISAPWRTCGITVIL
jgi:Ran GTPase-activating protein (RanGAP) involved in mRNA processing and transport